MGMKPTPKYYYRRLQRLRGEPCALAGGIALGGYVSITPTMPFHILLIIFLTIITRTSTVAGVLSGVMVCNPLTCVPIYYFSFQIGKMLMPYDMSWETLSASLARIFAGELFGDSLYIIRVQSCVGRNYWYFSVIAWAMRRLSKGFLW